MAESDAQRLKEAPEKAFDWVARELEMPNAKALEDLRSAFLSVYGEGEGKAVRVLEGHWAGGARWPKGEAYLRTLGWRSPDEFIDDDEADSYADTYRGPELLGLLYQRLFHVSHRLYRDKQVRNMLAPASPQRVPHYTHARLNRDGDFRGDPCGHGVDKIISIEEALRLMEQPAHTHPACACTIDPFPITGADRARLKASSGE